MKKGDVTRQKCVNNTFYLTGILAHKVNNNNYSFTNTCLYSSVIIRHSVGDDIYVVYKYLSVQLCNNQTQCRR